jgi:hypothetical protein
MAILIWLSLQGSPWACSILAMMAGFFSRDRPKALLLTQPVRGLAHLRE